MIDLIISTSLQHCFPTLTEGMKKAQNIFDSVKSFKDVERVFLLGQGLSPNTYRSYLLAVKQFYAFTKGLNPLQVRPGDIEAFYDDICKKVDRNTAYLRIKGLKRFFAGIRNLIPIYTSPFEIMSEKLSAKLNRTRKKWITKKALTKTEVNGLMAMLREDTSLMGRQNHAIVWTLVTTGLRAAELGQLRWRDVSELEGRWTVRFVGKGDVETEQEVPGWVVKIVLEAFRFQFHCKPGPEDHLFHSLPHKGQPAAPGAKHTLWFRLKGIYAAAREQGIIKREIQFSAHLFRRTYATLLHKAGMGLKALQEKTRHSNIEVLAKHYIDDSEPATPYLERIFEPVLETAG